MGVAPSKLEDDKVLVLCQERKRFVREALDGRCALAASHRAYILSLRETASLLRKCFEPEVLKESIPNVSPPLLPVNHMSAGRNSMTAPAKVTAQSSFPAAREVSQNFENADGLRSLREEGIPEHSQGDDDFAELEDNFDNPSTETRAPVFKNWNDVLVDNTHSPAQHASENIASQSTNSCSDNSKNKRTVIGMSKKPSTDLGNVVKDLNTCMKEIEILFFWACNSGKEVPRILEEDKIQFRPLLPEEIG